MHVHASQSFQPVSGIDARLPSPINRVASIHEMLLVFASKPQGHAYDRVYAYAPLRVATLGIAKGSSHAEVYDASTWVNKTSTKTKVWISTVAGLRLSCFRISCCPTC